MKKYIFLSIAILFVAVAQPVSAETSFVISEGWNLVSADVMFGLNLQDFINNRGGALFVLNPKDKKYYGGSGNFQTVTNSLEEAQNLLPTGDNVSALGWWVYTPKRISLSLDFKIPENKTSYYEDSYRFFKGWNLIGVTSSMLNRSIMEVKGTCEFVSVYHFENGTWRKQSDSDLLEKLTMDSLGYALAVKVVNECGFNFAKSVSAPQVPNLPE